MLRSLAIMLCLLGGWAGPAWAEFELCSQFFKPATGVLKHSSITARGHHDDVEKLLMFQFGINDRSHLTLSRLIKVHANFDDGTAKDKIVNAAINLHLVFESQSRTSIELSIPLKDLPDLILMLDPETYWDTTRLTPDGSHYIISVPSQVLENTIEAG